MINLLHRNDKKSLQFTLNIKKSHRHPPLHFATRVRRWRAVRLSSSSPFFMLAAACKMRASISSSVSTFFLSFLIRSSSTSTTRNLTVLGLGIQTPVSRYSFKTGHLFIQTFFLAMYETITSHNINLSS
jgi:hypothetical protein